MNEDGLGWEAWYVQVRCFSFQMICREKKWTSKIKDTLTACSGDMFGFEWFDWCSLPPTSGSRLLACRAWTKSVTDTLASPKPSQHVKRRERSSANTRTRLSTISKALPNRARDEEFSLAPLFLSSIHSFIHRPKIQLLLFVFDEMLSACGQLRKMQSKLIRANSINNKTPRVESSWSWSWRDHSEHCLLLSSHLTGLNRFLSPASDVWARSSAIGQGGSKKSR